MKDLLDIFLEQKNEFGIVNYEMKRIYSLSNIQILLVLLFISLIVYFPLLFAGFVGDDKEQLYNYALVNSFLSLPKVFFYHHVVLESHNSILSGYYKPLMLLYFYSLRILFGVNPFIFHFLQMILSCVNSFLVYLLFSKFFKKNLSLFLGILFLVHPINQEVVSYVSNIQETLFFLFGMLGLLLNFRQKTSWKFILGTFSFLSLSLLSKEAGILFIIILFTYHLLFSRKLLKKIFAVEICVIIFYSFLRFTSRGTDVFWIEPPPLAKVIFTERIKHIPLIFFYYVKTFFYPDVLAFNQQWIVKNFQAKTFLLPLIFDVSFISVLLSTVFLFFKKKLEHTKVLLFFTIWFFVGILPHLQLIPLDATVATRWFYFSSVGIVGILGVSIETFEKKYIHLKLSKNAYIYVGIFILISMSFRTYMRNLQWKDALTLYSTDAEISKSPLMENNLGDEYFKLGNFTKAQEHFQKALKLDPNLWIAINNMGTLEEQKKNYEKAYYYYEQALQRSNRLPLYENIGRVLVLTKKSQEANIFLDTGLSKYPLSAKLWLTKSLANYDLGKLQEALEYAKKSYELLPDPKTQNVIDVISEKINSSK